MTQTSLQKSAHKFFNVIHVTQGGEDLSLRVNNNKIKYVLGLFQALRPTAIKRYNAKQIQVNMEQTVVRRRDFLTSRTRTQDPQGGTVFFFTPFYWKVKLIYVTIIEKKTQRSLWSCLQNKFHVLLRLVYFLGLCVLNFLEVVKFLKRTLVKCLDTYFSE